MLVPLFVYRMLWIPLGVSVAPPSTHTHTLRVASCHVVNYPLERSAQQRTEGGFWPIASQELNPAQPCEETGS